MKTMYLWWLPLIFSVISATQDVGELRKLVDESKQLAKSLLPLYASLYACAYFMKQIDQADIETTQVEVALRRREENKDGEAEQISSIRSTVRCASAEIFLLQVEHDYWRRNLSCLQHYSQHTEMGVAAYAFHYASEQFVEAIDQLHRIFDGSRMVSMK